MKTEADAMEAEFLTAVRVAAKDLSNNRAGYIDLIAKAQITVLMEESANRIEWRNRQILQADAAFERIRSLLRGLPRSATAESIDRVCAEALGESEGQWPAEQGQFGVGA